MVSLVARLPDVRVEQAQDQVADKELACIRRYRQAMWLVEITQFNIVRETPGHRHAVVLREAESLETGDRSSKSKDSDHATARSRLEKEGGEVESNYVDW
jgi:hypothetical protein